MVQEEHTQAAHMVKVSNSTMLNLHGRIFTSSSLINLLRNRMYHHLTYETGNMVKD